LVFGAKSEAVALGFRFQQFVAIAFKKHPGQAAKAVVGFQKHDNCGIFRRRDREIRGKGGIVFVKHLNLADAIPRPMQIPTRHQKTGGN
jgi:hypothetical protein